MSNGDFTRSYKITEQVELAPLRTLDDFLTGSARFQLPQFNDPARWSNRITCNLLYYQTNYFLVGAIIFCLIGCVNPRDVILGFFCVAMLLGIVALATTTQPDVLTFKKDHSLVCLGIVLIVGYICVHMANAIMVFVFAMAFPMLMAFTHASLRLRNLKNKIANKAEVAGVTKTIMGHILDMIGCKPELIQVE